MRAIILAAGEGTRLRQYTEDKPKCLVEYMGKTILDYQLETMRECGIDDIVVVTGYKAEKVKREGLRYVLNENYDSTNMVYSLFCAKEYFDDDIIVSYGDIIYEKSILEQLMASQSEFALAVSTNWKDLWSLRMEDPLLDAETLKLDDLGNVKELGKKPKSYDDIEGQYMGLFKLSTQELKRIESFYNKLDRKAKYDNRDFNNMFMTSFIQSYIDARYVVAAILVDGKWLEIDTNNDLAIDWRSL